MVKKSQAYYWTNKWQEGIKESEKAMERGEFEVFNNIDDAARSFTCDKKIVENLFVILRLDRGIQCFMGISLTHSNPLLKREG